MSEQLLEKYKDVNLKRMYTKLSKTEDSQQMLEWLDKMLVVYDALVTQEQRDAIIKPLEEKYKGINLFDMCDKLAESTETEHLVKSMGAIHSPAENVTGDDILVAYDKAVTKEYRDKVIKPLEEKYKGVGLFDMCDRLAKSESTIHLVDWFGDYAMWEPALNVKKDDILIAYDKVMTSEQQKTSQQNRVTHRSR